jgi:hypothetical protein
MTPVSPTTTIPKTLRDHLSDPQSPWQISAALFARLAQQPYEPGGTLYKKCLVRPEDPECRFILTYFNHQKPDKYGISKIFCLHNPSLSKEFEASIEKIDKRAETFKPEWDKEALKAQREQVIQRWKEQADQFYPISIKRTTRTDTFFNIRMLPLWHGTSKAACHSIASLGFTYFGKHHFFNPDAKPGVFKSTDPGYYGNGVYFANSSKYAEMYNAGNLLLAWVMMKEPYPVVNDVPHPQQGSDMKKLRGAGAYQTYNAHYIPVAPISDDLACMEYYPCYHNQLPHCDELVVFQESQTLPRFWIELAVDFPTRLSPHSPIPGAFVVSVSSLPATILAGLSINAKCSTHTCSQKDQTQWVSLGLGTFNVAEVYHATACPSCKVDFAAIDHLMLHHSTYSLNGKQQDGSAIRIVAQSLPTDQAIMISHLSGWKYVNITLN